MKLVVAGVPRSGTTLLYETLAARVAIARPGSEEEPWHTRYEPYLWRLSAPRIAGGDFNTDSLDPYGIFVHTSTPLFLASDAAEHSRWLRDHVGMGARNSMVVKIVRGCGRLRGWLDSSPDSHILVVLRNPLHVLNSVKNRFSLFGTDFHPSDAPRFIAALPEKLRAQAMNSWADRAVLFHREMTIAMLKLADVEPARVHLLAYEQLISNPEMALNRISSMELPGYGPLAQDWFEFDRSSGPRTSEVSLSLSEQAIVHPYLEEYAKLVEARDLTPTLSRGYWRALSRRAAEKAAVGVNEPLFVDGTDTAEQLRHQLSDVMRRLASAEEAMEQARLAKKAPMSRQRSVKRPGENVRGATASESPRSSVKSRLGQLVRRIDVGLLEHPKARNLLRSAYRSGPAFVRSATRRLYASR